MVSYQVNLLVKELLKENPNRDLVLEQLDKFIDPARDSKDLISSSQSLGDSLGPDRIMKLVPYLLDCGLLNNCCDRAKFSLQIIVGRSDPHALIGDPSGTRSSLWETIEEQLRAKSRYYSPGFAPIMSRHIPVSSVPKCDQAKMPRFESWH